MRAAHSQSSFRIHHSSFSTGAFYVNEYVFILDPAAPLQRSAARVKPLESLKGKVVGFIDNAKPNFNHLADDLSELLLNNYGVASVVRHRKRAASISASAEMLQDLKAKCDVVITGSGD
jgi:hypothetical protein